MPIAGTEYDFTSLRNVENRVKQSGKGYDVNYKLDKSLDSLELVATVIDPESGRVLECLYYRTRDAVLHPEFKYGLSYWTWK